MKLCGIVYTFHKDRRITARRKLFFNYPKNVTLLRSQHLPLLLGMSLHIDVPCVCIDEEGHYINLLLDDTII